jgi:hypothetical protein
MNSFAVWRGYLNGLKILPVGFAIVGLMMLFSGEQAVDGSIILDNCFRLSLFIGGFIAGINAQKTGYLHGGG